MARETMDPSTRIWESCTNRLTHHESVIPLSIQNIYHCYISPCWFYQNSNNCFLLHMYSKSKSFLCNFYFMQSHNVIFYLSWYHFNSHSQSLWYNQYIREYNGRIKVVSSERLQQNNTYIVRVQYNMSRLKTFVFCALSPQFKGFSMNNRSWM